MELNRVWLIRHGRPASTWGEGDGDPGLDEVGRAQARAVADHLWALSAEGRPSRVVSSPLRRCRETATPLLERMNAHLEIDPDVAEIPSPSGLSGAARSDWLRVALGGRWADIEGDHDYPAWRDAIVATLVQAAGCAVFTHYVAINAALSAALGDPRVLVHRPDHASITRLAIVDGRLAIEQLGRQAVTQVIA